MLNLEKNNHPLDLSYLSEMSGDSPEFMIEMIDMFKQQTPIYLDDLKKAIDAQDWSRTASCAHKMKPTFAYVGRDDAKEHMQWIEHHARDQQDLGEIPGKFDEVNEFVNVLYKQLDDAKAVLSERL
jgi:HPt (histidine-containing phosphotransfer) domain-containing protein